ncbi:MAG: FAD-dependent oxidoreductase [Verrucomicrobiae bacterium]|nr:FAD-dependent oxidoreductase [Verrucomicrobiae bacterium]
MNRTAMLETVAASDADWDLIIVGGGATGLGSAVDAASRGFRTLLLEQADFAEGTSSRSTKLIHGGVRYLRNGELGLVRESLRERGRLLRHAPNLVKPLPFVVPGYRWHERFFFFFLHDSGKSWQASLRTRQSRRSLAPSDHRGHPAPEPRPFRGLPSCDRSPGSA